MQNRENCKLCTKIIDNRKIFWYIQYVVRPKAGLFLFRFPKIKKAPDGANFSPKNEITLDLLHLSPASSQGLFL